MCVKGYAFISHTLSPVHFILLKKRYSTFQERMNLTLNLSIDLNYFWKLLNDPWNAQINTQNQPRPSTFSSFIKIIFLICTMNEEKITKYGNAASIMNNWELCESDDGQKKSQKKSFNRNKKWTPRTSCHYKDIIKNVCRVNIFARSHNNGWLIKKYWTFLISFRKARRFQISFDDIFY